MDERLLGDDWWHVFEYARLPLRLPPLASTSTRAILADEVVEVAWLEPGVPGFDAWLVGGRLADGRWFFVSSACSGEGWSDSAGKAYVADSRGMIERFAMGDQDRDRLGVDLPHRKMRRRSPALV